MSASHNLRFVRKHSNDGGAEFIPQPLVISLMSEPNKLDGRGRVQQVGGGRDIRFSVILPEVDPADRSFGERLDK